MTIGIICAMDPEAEALVGRLSAREDIPLGAALYHRGRLFEREVVIVRSGIGKVAAAAVATALITVFKAGLIINSGSAGALAADLNLGDTVFSTKVAHHDVDLTIFGYKPGQMAGHEQYFTASPELIAKAEIAAATVPQIRDHARKGLVLSGDQFVSSAEKKEALARTFKGAMVTEMEGAAIAQVATDFKIPFLIIRAVSDGACEGTPMTFEEFLPLASENSCRLVLALVKLL